MSKGEMYERVDIKPGQPTIDLMDMIHKILGLALHGHTAYPNQEIARLTKLAAQWEEGYRENWRLLQDCTRQKMVAVVGEDQANKKANQLKMKVQELEAKIEKQQDSIAEFIQEITTLKISLENCGDCNSKLLQSGPGELETLKLNFRLVTVDRTEWKNKAEQHLDTIAVKNNYIFCMEKVLDSSLRDIGMLKIDRDQWHINAVNTDKAHLAALDTIERLKKTTASLTFIRVMEFGKMLYNKPFHAVHVGNFEADFWKWYQETYPTEQ